jgi:hypothetical protein
MENKDNFLLIVGILILSSNEAPQWEWYVGAAILLLWNYLPRFEKFIKKKKKTDKRNEL